MGEGGGQYRLPCCPKPYYMYFTGKVIKIGGMSVNCRQSPELLKSSIKNNCRNCQKVLFNAEGGNRITLLNRARLLVFGHIVLFFRARLFFLGHGFFFRFLKAFIRGPGSHYLYMKQEFQYMSCPNKHRKRHKILKIALKIRPNI